MQTEQWKQQQKNQFKKPRQTKSMLCKIFPNISYSELIKRSSKHNIRITIATTNSANSYEEGMT